MWKRFGLAWLTFWFGVVIAIIAWAAFSFTAGLLGLAASIALTVIMIVAGLFVGSRKTVQPGHRQEADRQQLSDDRTGISGSRVVEGDIPRGNTPPLRGGHIH